MADYSAKVGVTTRNWVCPRMDGTEHHTFHGKYNDRQQMAACPPSSLSLSPSLSLSLVFRSTQLFGLLSRTQPSRCPEAPLDFILACITGHAQDIVEVMLFPTFASGSGSHEIYSFANQCTVRDWRQVIKLGLSKMMHDLQTDFSSGSTNTNLRKQIKTITVCDMILPSVML